MMIDSVDVYAVLCEFACAVHRHSVFGESLPTSELSVLFQKHFSLLVHLIIQSRDMRVSQLTHLLVDTRNCAEEDVALCFSLRSGGYLSTFYHQRLIIYFCP